MHTTFYLGVLCLLCWYHQAILLRMWTIQYNLLYMARYVPISRYLPNYRFHTYYINLLTMAGNNYVRMIWQDFFDTITVLKKIVSRWPTSHFYWNFGVIYIIVRGFVPGGGGGAMAPPYFGREVKSFSTRGEGSLYPQNNTGPPLIFRPSYDSDRIIYFSVVWSFIALKWLLSTLYFQEDDYKNWDPHLKLTKAVLASICLDVLLAGSELFHKVRLEMRKRRQTTEAAQEVEMLNHPPPPQSRA